MPVLAVAPSISIAYEIVGVGDPILLVHGFASNRSMNWRTPGWFDTLSRAGRQVIAPDMRGHGESSKPHQREAYDEGEMAGDVVRLLDHLGLPRADVMGYSMGGFIVMRLLRDHPGRIRRAVVAGVGNNYYGRGPIDTDAIAAGLREPDAARVTGAVPRTFRIFAEQGRNDLEALALCMTRDRTSVVASELEGLTVPVLIVVGEKDNITGPPPLLAESIPGALVAIIPGRDHMSTVGDKAYKAAVLEFLA
jgi:pimeloyl-ACP methyl ester carboxylesterase